MMPCSVAPCFRTNFFYSTWMMVSTYNTLAQTVSQYQWMAIRAAGWYCLYIQYDHKMGALHAYVYVHTGFNGQLWGYIAICIHISSSSATLVKYKAHYVKVCCWQNMILYATQCKCMLSCPAHLHTTYVPDPRRMLAVGGTAAQWHTPGNLPPTGQWDWETQHAPPCPANTHRQKCY